MVKVCEADLTKRRTRTNKDGAAKWREDVQGLGITAEESTNPCCGGGSRKERREKRKTKLRKQRVQGGKIRSGGGEEGEGMIH